MANRSYLYSASSDLKRLRDLSEWRSAVPLFHQILLGVNPKLHDSIIWEYEHPIAIVAEFEAGIKKYLDFLTYIKTLEGADTEQLQKAKDDLTQFFEENPDRKGQYFFLEAGEVYDLIGDLDPINEQNERMLAEIKQISVEITEILETKPKELFSFSNSYWLKRLQANEDEELFPYLRTVTYWSMNKSE